MRRLFRKGKVLACLLILAMVVSLFPAGVNTTAYAAESGEKNLRLHFYNTYDWAEPALQFWPIGTAEVSGETTTLESWGVDVTKLKSEGDGWYTLTIKGKDFSGFQFLDYANPDANTAGKGYSKAMEFCTGDEPTDLYCKFDKETDNVPTWYLDKEYTTIIDTLDPDYDPNKEPEKYTYNVYYYDTNLSHMATDSTDLWVWEEGAGNIGAIEFTSLETLEDGKQWLKASFETTATDLGMILRSYGEWSWQTGNHYYKNTDKAAVTDLYIVYGDDSNTYTTLPEIKKLRDRYVVVEYERADNDYSGWNIYSWNSGFGSGTEIYTEEIDGKHYFVVPVKDSEKEFILGFCMRHSTEENMWESKDGGDHYITVPADQNVVKAKFVQGEGVVSTLAYNKGYEIKGSDNKIDFYYRDDMLLKDCKESSLEGKVKVVINGKSYSMKYDSKNERYYYSLTNCKTGDYAYYYLVNGNVVLDAYNDKTTTYKEKECSLLTFKKFSKLTVSASVKNKGMSYDENNVLSVSFKGDDAKKITDDEIKSIKVDLKALGGATSDVDISLKKLSISVLNTVKNGKKKLPVTVTDIYGNVYKANAYVNVVSKTTSDFDWDEANIYFTVTDRFFDGNSNNNEGVDKEGTLSYHGGDFAGLQKKLSYLKDLGVNTIWITPIVSNSDTTTEKEDEEIESTGYHGYWADDFTKLNPHLGTEKEFSSLIKAVHKNGMKLMVDVVLNHAGYETSDYFNTLLKDDDGNYIPMIRDDSNTITGDDVYSSLSGLPDFVTENEAVRDQLIDWQTNWVEKYGIDYFRIDTVKHVDKTTWSALKNELTAIDPQFKMIGEYAGAGYANNAEMLGTGRMDSVLDFDFNDQAQSFVNGNISSVETFLENRNKSLNNTATLGSFLSSHDEDGLVYKLINENGFKEDEALDLFKVAASLQLTAKGQTIIYYGEELGQYGANDYPYQTNRYDFDWDEAEKQAKDQDSMLNHYKKLLKIRNQYKDIFTKGNREKVVASDEEKYEVFKRTSYKNSLYVGLNLNSTDKEVTVKVDSKKGVKYKDLYTGKTYTTDKNGKVKITIPATSKGGTSILVKNDKPSTKINFKSYITKLMDIFNTYVKDQYKK